MAEEEYKYTPEDIGQYRHIALAEEYLKNKDQGGLEQSILSFFENIGVKKEKDRKGIESAIRASPQGLQSFISNFMNDYKGALASSTLKQLRALYSGSFEKFYTEENLPKVDAIFNSDETYGDFMKKYAEAAEIAQSETDNFTKEQKEQAEKYINELNKIALPLKEFENLELYKLKSPVDEKSLRYKLNTPYKEKPREESEEYMQAA